MYTLFVVVFQSPSASPMAAPSKRLLLPAPWLTPLGLPLRSQHCRVLSSCTVITTGKKNEVKMSPPGGYAAAAPSETPTLYGIASTVGVIS